MQGKRTHLARLLRLAHPVSHEFGQLREHRVQPASTLLAKRRAIRLGVMITLRLISPPTPNLDKRFESEGR